MALNLNGVWEKGQLSPELQNTFNKYRENFNGTSVGTCDNSILESNIVGGEVQESNHIRELVSFTQNFG